MEERETILDILDELAPGAEVEGCTTLVDDRVLDSLTIVALVAVFFTGGLVVVPFMLLAAWPLVGALLKNPLAPPARVGAMAQVCSVNVALGAFYAAAILASGTVLAV